MGAREVILPYLVQPRCQRELWERSGLTRKAVEHSLMRAKRAGLVICVTPELRQARLYLLTPIGRRWVQQQPRRGTSQAPEVGDDITSAGNEVLLQHYGWVQAGRYRRLVVRHLVGSLTTRELRGRILKDYQRLGPNHVRRTLRALIARGLAMREGQRWMLTPLGRQLQAHQTLQTFGHPA